MTYGWALMLQSLKDVLSPRRFEVTTFVAGGYSNRDIALLLGTTENVIKNYLRLIYEQLDMSDPNAGCADMTNRLKLANRFAQERKAGSYKWSAAPFEVFGILAEIPLLPLAY